MKHTAFKIVMLALILLNVAVLPAADWPRWRGPDADGLSKETDWNPESLKENPKILWEVNIGNGHSTLSLADGRLFGSGNRMAVVGQDTLFEEVMFCLDAETGREIWRHGYIMPEGTQWPGPQSSPFIEDSSIYMLGREGQVFCYDAETGFVNWGRNLVSDSLTTLHPWGFSASPIIESDLLLINAGASGLALNKQTGDIIWKSANEVNGYASPVVFDHQGERWATMQGAKELYFVEVKSGEIRYTFEWVGLNDPIFLDEGVFLTAGRESRNKGRMLLNWRDGGQEVIWHNKKQDVAFQNWIIIDGYAYGIFRNRDHRFECMNPLTGEIMWSEDLGIWGGITAAGDKLLMLTGQGELIIAQATPKAMTPVSRGRVLEMPDTTDLPHPRQCFMWTQPIFANGKLYARNTFGQLICLDLR